MEDNQYINSLKKDSNIAKEYYEKSLVKTEQQKFLEELLKKYCSKDKIKIADVACGGGTLSYHLCEKFPNAEFYLSDMSSDALEIAKSINSGKINFTFDIADITALNTYKENQFDFVFCWQTLSWLNKPEVGIKELIRIAKPGARIFCSSLFNLERDVDIYSKVVDNTRPSTGEGLSYSYNTYSRVSLDKWILTKLKAKAYKLHPFNSKIPFEYNGKGIGTSTIKTCDNNYIQISGGMLMNWAILEIIL